MPMPSISVSVDRVLNQLAAETTDRHVAAHVQSLRRSISDSNAYSRAIEIYANPEAEEFIYELPRAVREIDREFAFFTTYTLVHIRCLGDTGNFCFVPARDEAIPRREELQTRFSAITSQLHAQGETILGSIQRLWRAADEPWAPRFVADHSYSGAD